MNIDWQALCKCGWKRLDHVRESVNGGLKPIPTPDGKCHGRDFEASK